MKRSAWLGLPVGWAKSAFITLSFMTVSLDAVGDTVWIESAPGSATGNGISADAYYQPYGGQVVLALNSADELNAAYSTYYNTTGRAGLHARILRGGVWQASAPGSDSSIGLAPSSWKVEFLHMATTGGDRPFVLWVKSNAGSGPSFYLTGLRYDGTWWAGIGGSDTATPFGSPSSTATPDDVTADADGNPVVFYMNNALYVKRYDGSAWAEMGVGSASGSGLFQKSWSPAMVCTKPKPGAQPVILWGSPIGYSTDEIYAMRWDGTAWQNMPGASSPFVTTSTMSRTPSACLATDNQPIFIGSGKGVMKFNGSAWQTLGTTNSLGFGFAGIACAPDGTLLAAGVEPTSNSIIARRYNPGANTWDLFGVTSAPSSEIGFSLPLYGQASPSCVGLAIDSAGTACLAWVTPGNRVYVKKTSIASRVEDWKRH
ncbi:MAG: hypothetical protein NTY46_08745 [Candidatus Sumerlaeota bacterium]|nr:hypothetical protein [Candidatus Sumerlaeota bacterium]